MTYSKLKGLVLEDYRTSLIDRTCYIRNGFLPSWDEENKKGNPDRGLRAYSTDTRWNQYVNGEISREKAVAFAIKRMKRKREKRTKEKLEYLEKIAQAQDLTEIVIEVMWKKSASYGRTPHVTVVGPDRSYVGTARGSGYDKESTAIANALNQSYDILKLLCELKEKGLAEGKSDFSATSVTGHDNAKICGDGTGYDVIPCFAGGCGVSCILDIFKRCGFNVKLQKITQYEFYLYILTKGEN